MHRLLYILCFWFAGAHLAAQPQVGDSTTLVVFIPEQDSVLLGDEVVWKLQILTEPEARLETIRLIGWDSIPDLSRLPAFGSSGAGIPLAGDCEILDFGQWEVDELSGQIILKAPPMERSEINGRLLLSNRIRMVFWEEGIFVPPAPLVQISRTGKTLEVEAQLRPVQVVIPEIEGFEPDSLQLIPIKPVLRGEPPRLPRSALLAGLAFLLFILILAGLVILRILRKKRARRAERWVRVDPAELAGQEIRLLDVPLQAGDLRAFSTGLSLSLRRFLENRYRIRALESATEDILRDLPSSRFDPMQRELLQRVLQQTDLVKYAKGDMSDEAAQSLKKETAEWMREQEQSEHYIRIPEHAYRSLFGQAPPPEKMEPPHG